MATVKVVAKPAAKTVAKPMAKKPAPVEEEIDEVEEADEGDAGVSFEDDADMGELVDLSGTEEDAGFELLPRGTYPVVVDEAEYAISSNGNKMISLTLAVEDGEYANRKLFTHIVFAEKTMGRAKKMIRTLGRVELLERRFDPEKEADSFVGCRARARVGIRKYEGENRNEVKQLLPAGESGDAFGAT